MISVPTPALYLVGRARSDFAHRYGHFSGSCAVRKPQLSAEGSRWCGWGGQRVEEQFMVVNTAPLHHWRSGPSPGLIRLVACGVRPRKIAHPSNQVKLTQSMLREATVPQ
jgi:hypothetical protein